MPSSIWPESLAAFSEALASTSPAPAGVTAAAVVAELGISLMIKAMSITGGHAELIGAARLEATHLRAAAHDDVGAVLNSIRIRDSASRRQAIDAPMRAARAAVASLELCVRASAAVKPSLAVDQRAAEALIAGALRAILMCIDANVKGHEDEYSDAIAERKSIGDRAVATGVNSL